MTISISTAEYAPKNKKAEVDGVVLIAKPRTSAFSLRMLEIQDGAKKINEADEKAAEKAVGLINETRETMLDRFVNREDAEKVFADLDTEVIGAVYKDIIEKGEDAD